MVRPKHGPEADTPRGTSLGAFAFRGWGIGATPCIWNRAVSAHFDVQAVKKEAGTAGIAAVDLQIVHIVWYMPLVGEGRAPPRTLRPLQEPE
jgi:hypothetical protein